MVFIFYQLKNDTDIPNYTFLQSRGARPQGFPSIKNTEQTIPLQQVHAPLFPMEDTLLASLLYLIKTVLSDSSNLF